MVYILILVFEKGSTIYAAYKNIFLVQTAGQRAEQRLKGARKDYKTYEVLSLQLVES